MGLSRLSIRWCWVGLYHGLFKKLWNNLKNSSNTWRWEVIQETLRWFHHKIEDGTYYTWFLEYQDFLDPSLALGSSIKDFRVRLLMRTWRYIDGWPLPIDTAFNDINIEKATWLEYKRDCFNLCELVLSDVRRDIVSCVVIVWLLHNQYREMQLGIAYRTLFMKCLFVLSRLWFLFSRPILQFQEYKSGVVHLASWRFR